MPIQSTMNPSENSEGLDVVGKRSTHTTQHLSSSRIDLKPDLRWAGLLLVLVSALYLSNSSLAGAERGNPDGFGVQLLASPSPTPTPQFSLHFPNIVRHGLGPRVEVLDAWMADLDGNPGEIFLINDGAQYIAKLLNLSDKSLTVDLRWVQSGPCGESVVFHKAVSIPPGEQQRIVEGIVPDCQGIYTVTAVVTDLGNTLSKSTLMVANPLSLVAVENHQGFDKCTVPTISQMQTWWVESPYWAVNMYIGGASRACDQPNLTHYWMNAVSQQGWTFIPTWVGPQAPCTTYRHRISSNKFTAYQEGKNEAGMAASAAVDLGLWGDLVIYYDLEAYSGDSACRNAVAYFMKGWVERLHQLGYQAGVYGSPCRSYLTDFAEISPAPDDVWIASWLTPYHYRPDVTVWLSGDAENCLSNDLWADHQRLRQYTGGHTETFGGLSFSIDSNATDGEVTVLPTPNPTPSAQAAGGEGIHPAWEDTYQAQVRLMQPLSAQAGWVLSGERLLMTGDGGESWQDITPQETAPAHLLTATFANPQQGWVVRQTASEAGVDSLEVLASRDGGQNWQVASVILPEATRYLPAAAAYLNFIDEQTGYLSIKLQSSSAFSLGRLFATRDGGRTWEQRSLPLGEAVTFLDTQRGWVAGGPGGSELYHTLDGGRTWQPQSLPLPFSSTQGQFYIGLPVFHNPAEGSLPVTLVGPAPRLQVYLTQDGGESWSLSKEIELVEEPGIALAFSAGSDGGWWAATPDANLLSAGLDRQANPAPLASIGLPQGVIALEFVDKRVGWALAQAGICRGEKISPDQGTVPGGQSLSCNSQSYLVITRDGGRTWQEITP
jgi:photosystem II stability/assembly factor-like uncharacterized protein